MRIVDHVAGQYHYALGDATNAYSREKMRKFTREIVFIPTEKLLFVFDDVVSADPSFRKAWLLHGVNCPSVDQEDDKGNVESKTFENASTFRFQEGKGELRVHSLLPRERVIIRRGGPGQDFFTPGDDKGGPWGSGENWPLEPEAGGPLPQDARLVRMWKAFWGEDFSKISPSNRKNVVPGAWRIEVSPSVPAKEDFFLHVFEIGDLESTGKKRIVRIDGNNFVGAAVEQGPCILFSTSESSRLGGEVSLPDIRCTSLIASRLQPNTFYEMRFYGPNVSSSPAAAPPGVETDHLSVETNRAGVLRLQKAMTGNLGIHIVRL
jgi:heparin/heparan-sulfate lyase